MYRRELGLPARTPLILQRGRSKDAAETATLELFYFMRYKVIIPFVPPGAQYTE